jgi:hypothetical protein
MEDFQKGKVSKESTGMKGVRKKLPKLPFIGHINVGFQFLKSRIDYLKTRERRPRLKEK